MRKFLKIMFWANGACAIMSFVVFMTWHNIINLYGGLTNCFMMLGMLLILKILPEDSFKEKVFQFIDKNSDKVQDLARECRVNSSTVFRWAMGTATPGPNVQKFILGKIKKLS